ncbi:MAG: biosynthetic peptidoglycan transglycosylase [Bdellovibrionota bacterium]
MFRFLINIAIALSCAVIVAGICIGLFLASTPRPTDIKGCLTTKMFEVRLCPGEPGYVRLKDVSVQARNAIVVSEDGAFYDHAGFDWVELRSSMEKNMEKGEYARGGSTITQQLAKNVYLSSEKSMLRKAREALITIQIEKLLTKDEILEKYLNVVEFGDKLYGIGKASQYYFRKPPSQLTAAEGAFLAFLLPSPKKYSVSFRNKQLTKFAAKQTAEIVNRLHRFKKIDDSQHEAALAEVRSLFGVPEPEPSLADALEQGVAPPEPTPSEDEMAFEAGEFE